MVIKISKHKVFISFHERDIKYKEDFVRMMEKRIVDKSVDTGNIDDTGLKTATVRQKIRDEYIRDATVAVVLIGPRTWQRKHVDWEIGSGIRKTKKNPRCGLLGILLPNHPSHNKKRNLDLMPPRLADNCKALDQSAEEVGAPHSAGVALPGCAGAQLAVYPAEPGLGYDGGEGLLHSHGVRLVLGVGSPDQGSGVRLVPQDDVDAVLGPEPASGVSYALVVQGASDVQDSPAGLGHAEDALHNWRCSGVGFQGGALLGPVLHHELPVAVGHATGHPEAAGGGFPHPPDDFLRQDISYSIDTKNSGTRGRSNWMQLGLNSWKQAALLQASHLWWIAEQVCRLPPYGFKPCEVSPAAPVFGLLASHGGSRVRAPAKEAGLGESFTGHLGRVGMAQDLATSGVELPALVTAGRWKSFKMPARYTERQVVGRGSSEQMLQSSGYRHFHAV